MEKCSLWRTGFTSSSSSWSMVADFKLGAPYWRDIILCHTIANLGNTIWNMNGSASMSHLWLSIKSLYMHYARKGLKINTQMNDGQFHRNRKKGFKALTQPITRMNCWNKGNLESCMGLATRCMQLTLLILLTLFTLFTLLTWFSLLTWFILFIFFKLLYTD